MSRQQSQCHALSFPDQLLAAVPTRYSGHYAAVCLHRHHMSQHTMYCHDLLLHHRYPDGRWESFDPLSCSSIRHLSFRIANHASSPRRNKLPSRTSPMSALRLSLCGQRRVPHRCRVPNGACHVTGMELAPCLRNQHRRHTWKSTSDPHDPHRRCVSCWSVPVSDKPTHPCHNRSNSNRRLSGLPTYDLNCLPIRKSVCANDPHNGCPEVE